MELRELRAAVAISKQHCTRSVLRSQCSCELIEQLTRDGSLGLPVRYPGKLGGPATAERSQETRHHSFAQLAQQRDARPRTVALDDPTIVAIFDAANTYDIETGQLALQKSHTKAVRDLAQQFVNDHKAVRQQGRDLAQKLKVTPTPPKQSDLATAHVQAMKELKGKSGAAFEIPLLRISERSPRSAR